MLDMYQRLLKPILRILAISIPIAQEVRLRMR